MARINDHYLKLQAGYLFPEIERRVKAYTDAHPAADLIRLGIGDVVLPLARSVREGMRRAIDEMGTDEGFRGYGPDQGYHFLREAIAENEYTARGASVSPEEIFVSDGSKCDSANFQEIFARDAKVAVPDPVYPVYVDSNVMAGRSGESDGRGHYRGIVYLPCREENGFAPRPPAEPVGLVYLCSPNNPTGTAMSREALAEWIAWAQGSGAVLLYDAAYADYVRDPALPRSIYEVEGAREVAVEFRSFSKSAGFTGLRCGWVVVPRGLAGSDASGNAVELWALWKRRQSTKFNGASYPVQVGAAATYGPRGRAELREQIAYYMSNAEHVREGLAAAGLRVFGGRHAPYVWASTLPDTGSWELFDRLLEEAQVVITPGAGFGPEGEGYFRVSAFGRRERVDEAVERIRKRSLAR